MSESFQPAENATEPIVCTRLDNFKIRAVVNFWNSCCYPHNRRSGITIDVLERQVFAKPFFDPNGFIIAWKGNKIVGLAHASFGFTDDYSAVDYSQGIIPLICYNDAPDVDAVLDALIVSCERHLVSKGATRIQIGTTYPHAPFYLGLFHSSDLSGVDLGESLLTSAASRHGYSITSSKSHFRRDLDNLDWASSSEFSQLRQRFSIQMEYCPTMSRWGEAIAMNGLVWSRFSLVELGQGVINAQRPAVQCALWVIDEDPETEMIAVGLSQCQVNPEYRGQRLGLFILSEAIRRLVDQQVERVEVQVPDEWRSLITSLSSHGFELFAHSALYSKNLTSRIE